MEHSKETSNNDFAGIWNRTDKPQPVKDTAEALKNTQFLPGTSPKKKTWGIFDVFINFLSMIAVQVILSIALSAFLIVDIITKNPNASPGELTTLLSSNPVLILVGGFGMYVVWVGGMKLVTKFKGANSFKIDFKLAFKKWDFFIGLGLALIAFAFIQVSSWLLGDIIGLEMSGSDNGSALTAQTGIAFFLIAILMASIVGPFCEELFFRGFLLNGIRKTTENRYLLHSQTKAVDSASMKISTWFLKHQVAVAVIISSIAFGMMHFQGVDTFGQWYVMIGTGTLGLIFALASVKTGRLGPAIFAHMIYNGSTILLSTI